MPHQLLPLLALLVAASLAYYGWTLFTRWEVARNAADILADGSADTLRKGYHARRTWARFWWWLWLAALGAAPAAFAGPWAFGLAFLAVGVLLAGYFARFFTPWLNIARGLPEFRASADSASWPDAAVWKQVRVEAPLTPASQLQGYANMRLAQLLRRTWLYSRLAAGVLGLAAAALVIHP